MELFGRKRDKKLEKVLSEINANAEILTKKFIDSQAVQALAQEIIAEDKTVIELNVWTDWVEAIYEDNSEKRITFSHKGLPKLSYDIELGAGWYEFVLSPHFDKYPYLAFCEINTDYCLESWEAYDGLRIDNLEFGGLYFNECRAVAYSLAKKLGMSPELDESGYPSHVYRKVFPTNSW